MTESTTVPPLAWVMLVGGFIWLYRLWRPSRDRNVANTFATAALPVGLIWMATILMAPVLPGWLAWVVFWGPLAVMGALLVASAVQNHRDRRADRQQRIALNLARRRRMLTQTQLAAVWILCGAVAFFALTLVTAIVLTAIDGGRAQPDRHAIDIGVIVMLAELAVLGLAGWIHIARRPAKIAREDERLRRLDLGDEDD
ncbi:hypothetical protein [Mycobacterium avium]|uniref:hypothetical protein n=1 Tax=Mycobacterium avium TaxID=1764 RepID=UPI000BAF6364|nr:hypothetical protein [Mycobacterium avium]PBA08471.1 hypothetical protein CKJ70_26205 [Mycobacterium avium]